LRPYWGAVTPGCPPTWSSTQTSESCSLCASPVTWSRREWWVVF